MKLPTKLLLAAAWLGCALATTSAQAAAGSFTGSYTTNFDGLGVSGTGMPLGFRSMVMAGGNSTFGATTPISAVGIAGATLGNQTLIIWNAGSAVASDSDQLFNVGFFGNLADRALGTDPTGTAANVIELSLTNKTGADLAGVNFSYDLKVMTNGSAGNEASELPGYAFFYSTSGGTTAAEWTRVDGLSLSNAAQGTVQNSGTVTINFPIPLTNNGTMFFRWADDNNVASSPDQMFAIDNLIIGNATNTPPTVTLLSPASSSIVGLGTNVMLQASPTDANGTITKVEFFYGSTKLGETNAAPWTFIWPATLPFGSNTLFARATDNDGAIANSGSVGLTVVPDTGTGGLFFDGVNDSVTFGPATASLGVSNFTVECWFKRQGTGTTTSTGTGGVTAFPLVTKGRGESDGSNVDCNWFLGFDAAGRLTADFEDFFGGTNHPITGISSLTSNVWQHAAVTYDVATGTWVLYLNGVPDATNVIAGAALTRTPRFDSIQHAGLGTAMTSTGAAQGFFAGRLDEVRVWNYARSAAQIASAMNSQIAAAPGLVGRWGLNEISGATAFDSSGSGVNGTLLNGPLWVAGYPFPPSSQPPIVSIASPPANAVFQQPATITVTANAFDAEGPVTNVEFFAGTTSLGFDSTIPFSVLWNSAPLGAYALTAVATDADGLTATSSVVNITILPPNLPPSVTAVVAPTNNATDVPKAPTLDVTVADPEGSNVTVTFYGRAIPPAPGPDFTILALPDTQFYSETYSNVFFAQTDWILSNRAALNIVYVPQLGDCVQNGDKGGNDNEWRVATNALYRLENPLTTLLPEGIPYGVAVGNHDQGPTGNGIATDTTTFYNQYFGTNHFLPYSYYGGNYGTNGDNFYELFSASGLDFIVIYFEYDTTLTSTNAPIFAWANNLLKTYPNRRGIVVSHYIINSYTSSSSFGPQGQAVYDALKGNPNLTLMLCGHVNPNGEGRRLDTFNGRPVWTLLSDYQDLANGGNGWLRIYTFSPSNNVVHAKTYSPFLDQYQTGTNSQFDVPYQLTPTNFTVIGTVSNVPSGADASLLWKALKPATSYEWFAAVSDGQYVSNGPLSRFSTAASFPAVPPTVTLTGPADNAVFSGPASITLTVNAADADGIVTNVAFYRGATKLADVATAPFTFVWNNLAAGSYALTAICSDDDGLTGTSSVVNVTVTNSPGVLALQQVKTVIVIAMENHNFTQPNPTSSPQQIFTNPAAPYINSLITPGHSNAAQVSYATKYYNAGIGVHPSEPSYVWAEGGTDFGVHTDNDPSAASANVFNAPHLTRQLNAAGIPWKNYQEDVERAASPTNSASGSSGPINPYFGTAQYNYAVKHNPMAFFTDTQVQNVYPFTNFLNDLTNNALGKYNWITPNQFNDMHSSLSGAFTYHGVSYTGDQEAIAIGDNFLSILIPKIMASPVYQDHGLIIIWWDESEGGDNTSFAIPEIIISPLARGNAYASSVEMNHSSDIKTVDEIFGLSSLNYFTNAIPAGETSASGAGYNNVATVNDLSDLFIGNHPPAALDATFARAANLSLKINIADLLSGFTSDPDSDARSLKSVGVSAQGAAISTNATHILYDPTNNLADTFGYTVRDGYGGEASATLNVVVVNPGGISQSIAAINGVLSVNFAGIPGFEYDVQHSTNLVDWVVKATLTAPPNGLFQFVETNAPSPSFYRLRQH